MQNAVLPMLAKLVAAIDTLTDCESDELRLAYVYPSKDTVECRYKDEYGVERKTLFAARSLTPNVEVQGPHAALSRAVPCNDGLCLGASSEKKQ